MHTVAPQNSGLRAYAAAHQTLFAAARFKFFAAATRAFIVAADFPTLPPHGLGFVDDGLPILVNRQQRVRQLALKLGKLFGAEGKHGFAAFVFIIHAGQGHHLVKQIFECFVVDGFKPIGRHGVEAVKIGVAPGEKIIVARCIGIKPQFGQGLAA